MSLNPDRQVAERLRRDPSIFISLALGSRLTPQQVAVCESVRLNGKTACPSGHGVGKSYLAARVALWFLVTRPGSKVVTSAPTWHQVENILWRELRSAHRKAKIPLGGTLLKTRLEFGEEWFGIGLSTDDPTRMQGIHAAAGVLVIFDEAVGIAPAMWDAAETLVVGASDRFLAIGNPTDPTSEMKKRCDSGFWSVVPLSCMDHPNVATGENVVAGAVTRQWVEQKIEEYGGEDSPLARARIFGKWPEQGSDALISLAWVEAAAQRWKLAPFGKGTWAVTAAGCDVARYGQDETVIFEIDERGTVSPAEITRGQNLMDTAGRLYNRRHIPNIAVDDCGLGGGVTDRCVETGVHVQPVNVGVTADDPDRFVNLRSEIFWHVREQLRLGKVNLPDDPKLLGELTDIKYNFDSKGRIRVEPKDEIKKRIGRSPDRADAFALTLWAARTPTEGGGYYVA